MAFPDGYKATPLALRARATRKQTGAYALQRHSVTAFTPLKLLPRAGLLLPRAPNGLSALLFALQIPSRFVQILVGIRNLVVKPQDILNAIPQIKREPFTDLNSLNAAGELIMFRVVYVAHFFGSYKFSINSSNPQVQGMTKSPTFQRCPQSAACCR